MLIGLISCTKAKTPHPAPARELYSPSALFRGALSALSGRADVSYVLSAKYGLLPMDQVVAPYDQTLLRASQTERAGWAHSVLMSLTSRHGPSLNGITFEFHTGVAYRFPLESLLQAAGAACTCPVAGLQIGERLAFYRGNPPGGKAAARRTVVAAARTSEPVHTGAPLPTDLRALCAGLAGEALTTGTGVPFSVESVEQDRVTVIPASSGKRRPILWRELANAYDLLERRRSVTLSDVRTEASEANPAYVFAILAKLPGARVTGGRPLRLEL